MRHLETQLGRAEAPSLGKQGPWPLGVRLPDPEPLSLTTRVKSHQARDCTLFRARPAADPARRSAKRMSRGCNPKPLTSGFGNRLWAAPRTTSSDRIPDGLSGGCLTLTLCSRTNKDG